MTSCPRFHAAIPAIVIAISAAILTLTPAFDRPAAAEPSVAPGPATKASGMHLVQRRCSDEEQHYCKLWSADCSRTITTYSGRESCKRKYEGCLRYGCEWSGPVF